MVSQPVLARAFLYFLFRDVVLTVMKVRVIMFYNLKAKDLLWKPTY